MTAPRTARRARSRWTSFVADPPDQLPDAGASADGPGPESSPPVRSLHEAGNPEHRLRVEHDAQTLLIHLSDEDGRGWTVIAVERPTRRMAVAQGRTQAATAQLAYRRLYPA